MNPPEPSDRQMDDQSGRQDPSVEAPDSRDGPRRSLAGSRWEWVAAVVSFVLAAAAISFLLLDAADAPDPPPAIEIAIDSVTAAGSGYLVEIHAHNTSATPAAAVVIEGALSPGAGADTEPERSRITLDYLPGKSSRAAGLFFSRDPGQGTLVIRPLGYQAP